MKKNVAFGATLACLAAMSIAPQAQANHCDYVGGVYENRLVVREYPYTYSMPSYNAYSTYYSTPTYVTPSYSGYYGDTYYAPQRGGLLRNLVHGLIDIAL